MLRRSLFQSRISYEFLRPLTGLHLIDHNIILLGRMVLTVVLNITIVARLRRERRRSFAHAVCS